VIASPRLVVTLVVSMTMLAALAPTTASAQQSERYSHRELQLLLTDAVNPHDYQKLADYFHHQHLLFRAKAESALNDYAVHAGRFTMASKFMTRAEVAARVYGHYCFKAEENEKLASRYDGLLNQFGIKPPPIESGSIVSVKSLLMESTRR